MNFTGKINKIVREFGEKDVKIDFTDSSKQSTFSFPFEIILGAVNYSEAGELANNVIPNDFSSFQQLFTGQDNVIAQWEGSTRAFLETVDDDFLTKEYSVGVAHSGIEIDRTISTAFIPSAQDIDFKSQQIIKTITIAYENWDPEEADFYKLHQIPQDGGKTWYYITNAIILLDPHTREFLRADITFKSLNDELSQSGQAVEQFIQFGAPGEGYAYPLVAGNEIQLSPAELKDYGVDEAQIEIYSGGITTSLLFMGRKIDDENSNRIEAPRVLFLQQPLTPLPSEITKTSGGEQNYYWINGEPEYEAYYENWKEDVASQYDLTKNRSYEGAISTNWDLTRGTNSPEDRNKYSFNESDWSILTYGDKVFNTQANPYVDGGTLTIPNEADITTLLNFASMIYLDVERLPLALNETTIWSLKDIPVIGGFLNLITFGIPIGWRDTDSIINAKRLVGILSSSLYDYGASSAILGTDGAITMDLFRNDTDDNVGALVGDNNLSQTFRFKLTDLVDTQIDGQTVERNTLDMGQPDTLETGQPNPNAWKFNNTTRAKANNGANYIIDLANVKILAKGDYKITFLNAGRPVWTGRYQTKAKFTGATREWSNTHKLSNWNEENGEVIRYPESIPQKPPNNGYDKLVVNFSNIQPARGLPTVGILQNGTQKTAEQVNEISPTASSNTIGQLIDVRNFGFDSLDDVIPLFNSLAINLTNLSLSLSFGSGGLSFVLPTRYDVNLQDIANLQNGEFITLATTNDDGRKLGGSLGTRYLITDGGFTDRATTTSNIGYRMEARVYKFSDSRIGFYIINRMESGTANGITNPTGDEVLTSYSPYIIPGTNQGTTLQYSMSGSLTIE